MRFQICHCGAQSGYLHAYDCPRPYYRDDAEGVRKWKRERRERRENLCAAGGCDELRTDGRFCDACAEAFRRGVDVRDAEVKP